MTRRSREALRYFLGRHATAAAVLLGLVMLSATLEGLTAASLFPFVAAIVGQDMEGRGGPILYALTQTVAYIPIRDKIVASALLLLTIVLLKGGAILLRDTLIAFDGARIVHEAKQTLLSRWAQAPYLFFKTHNGHPLSSRDDLHHQLSVAPQSLAAVLLLLPYAATQLFTMTVIVVLLLSMGWRLTLFIATAGLIVYLSVNYVSQQVSYSKGMGQREKQSIENRILREFLLGIHEITVARASSFWLRRFDAASEGFRRLYASDLVWQSAPKVLLETIFFVLLCLLVLLYRWLVDAPSGGFVPTMAVYAYAVYRLVGSSSVLSGQLAKINSKCPDLELLHEGIRDVPVKEYQGGHVPAPLTRKITFKHVSFTYPGREEPTLKDISCDIDKGTVTAIMGENGSGKTTLVNLLVRLFDPTSGLILVDGENISTFDRDAWLGKIGYVGAASFLFTGTVEENIRFGLLTPTREEIEAAAVAAHAHDFIEQLPQGYETVVGERGTSLSDGQRQRLAIARAILRGPEILIFDEGTSAVDSGSERLIQEAIVKIAKEITLIVVAHRFSTVRIADQILMLDRGRIVEAGSHDELLARRGQYSMMMAAAGE